jgi:glutathione S-transferase
MRLYDYAASGNCYKVRLLLAQLGIPYERVPVLVPDEGPPLAESNAILLHLAEGTGLLPADPADRAQAYRWLLFEQADVIPAIAGLRFRLLTGRLEPDDPRARARRADGEEVLRLLDRHLAEREFLVDGRYSVADIALYAYVHVAPDAGYALPAAVESWTGRVEAQPGFVDDLEPYPANARPGASRSIYDPRA